MKISILFSLLFLAFSAHAELKAAGPAKVFEGPEGEEIAMVEVNGSTEMLVQFRGIAGLDDQTRLYKFNDMGGDKKEVFYDKKKGSKTQKHVVLAMRGGVWSFYHPEKNSEFNIRYSKEESKKIKADDIIKAYKP